MPSGPLLAEGIAYSVTTPADVPEGAALAELRVGQRLSGALAAGEPGPVACVTELFGTAVADSWPVDFTPGWATGVFPQAVTTRAMPIAPMYRIGSAEPNASWRGAVTA